MNEAVTAEIELTVLMPCLNEAETVAVCIREVRRFLDDNAIVGEILVVDNGSHDGSAAIAREEGARVVTEPTRGYGAALRAGIAAAQGRYVIMGDADCSYDFAALMPFVIRLRGGADLVVGDRFAGGIAPGAMPLLHRYLGNHILSWFGRMVSGAAVRDFHCGLRGFHRARMMSLGLSSNGMEFASEMIARAALSGYRLAEVPASLSRAGRSRPSHLRTWRDGFRHLWILLCARFDGRGR